MLRYTYTLMTGKFVARRWFLERAAQVLCKIPGVGLLTATAAVANKLARTIWAVLAKGKPYDRAAFSAVA